MERDKGGSTSEGYYRPHDWALVTTSLGSMMEPFCMFARTSRNVNIQNTDWTDDMSRIDRIEMVDLDKQMTFFGESVNGGNMLPRAGR